MALIKAFSFRTAAAVEVVAGTSGQEIRAAPEERFVRRQHVLCHLQRASEKFQKLNAERKAPTIKTSSLAHLLVAAVQEVAFQRDVEPVRVVRRPVDHIGGDTLQLPPRVGPQPEAVNGASLPSSSCCCTCSCSGGCNDTTAAALLLIAITAMAANGTEDE